MSEITYRLRIFTLARNSLGPKIVRDLITLISLSLCFGACTGKIEAPLEESSAGEIVAGDPHTMGEVSAGTSETTTEDSAGTSEATTENSAGTSETATEVNTGTNSAEEMPNEELSQVSLDELDRTPIDETEESDEVSLVAPEPIAILERPRRRMNLDQLDRAIRHVSGGLFWSELRNGREDNLFESLSATFGKPDFIQRTSEDLTPSALFMKFIDDAARQVCHKRIDIDLNALNDPRSEQVSTEILLWGALSPDLSEGEDSSRVDSQIRALVLRFHSQLLPEGESPRLAYWRWLFETASLVDHSPLSGWRALCVALINHPDFYSY